MKLFQIVAFIGALNGEIATKDALETRENASGILSRVERFFLLEEMKQGNLERECIEEQFDPCNREENWEVFDNDELHRESWSKLKGCFNKLTSQNRMSKSNLRNCYDNDHRKLPLP